LGELIIVDLGRLACDSFLIILQIKQQATGGFQAFIIHYRDDPDQQNLIDWIQDGWV